MRAFVLAAGVGQRLGPLTADVPKPMLQVGGRPILEYNVRLLVRHGITDIWINTHHKPEAIVAHFGDGSRFGAHITYTFEEELRGTAGALNAVRTIFDDTFLVVYGDNVTTCDLGRLRARHGDGALATIALFYREGVAHSGIVALDDRDRILAFVEKPSPEERFSHWVNAGLLVLEPRIFDFIPERAAGDFGRDVLPAALRSDAVLLGYRMTERLWWIDSPEDYARTATDPELRAPS